MKLFKRGSIILRKCAVVFFSFFIAQICIAQPPQPDSAFKGVLGVDTLGEITIVGEKSSMQLALDKRVFNVGKDLANAGGSALDVLMNVPSLSVDAEGRVRLRGSDNVRILIDGKPSGLVSFKGGSGLQQLQASMIERVEIITNPSARYEAEGMAGILNIVLKKEKRQGFNGSLEAVGGDPANFGAAANLNYRHKKVNFFINYSLAYRKPRSRSNLYQETSYTDTLSILKQNNEMVLKGLNNNIRGGIDYFFSETSVLTGSYLYRRSDANRLLNIRYEDYLFNTASKPSVSTRHQDENEDEPNSEYSLIYKKNFKEKDHELTAEMKFLDNWESSKQLFTQRFYNDDGGEDMNAQIIQNSLNDEWEKQFLVQLDYVRPMWKEGKIETGFRTSFRDMKNDYVVSQQNAAGDFEPLPNLDNVFLYDENIHAAYGIVANKQKQFSYQAGLRAEWTDVKTILEETNEVNPRKYVNLFPSAHVTYELKQQNSIQLSYSKRVRRPFYNDLSPFSTFSDSRNFFSGNPDLNPEFSNVIEAGHLKTFDKGSISSSIYFRHTDGKIQSIRTVDANGNATTIPRNLISEQAFGAEFISNYSPFTWWKIDFNINFFHADVDGSNIIKEYKTSTNSWFARQTSRFSFPNLFDVQLRFNYEAPQRTVQGRQLALHYTDISASKDILKGNGTINLTVLDVFNTRWSRYISTGPNFYTEGESQPRRRQINLTVNYRIRQGKDARGLKIPE
jgi:outer membrane receptor protein involved in Fe transport